MSKENTNDITTVVEVKKKRGRQRKGYFYEREEEAFYEFITSTDQKRRNFLFSTILYPAFTKMIESIIRRYNLFVPEEEFEVTFNATMSFLLTKVNNFKIGLGCKVYSYCGTVCKNYLLFRRCQKAKEINRGISYELVFKDSDEDDNTEQIDDFDIEALTFHDYLIKSLIETFELIIFNSEKYKLNYNDIKVGESLVFILSNWEDLFQELGSKKYNKSLFTSYMKEATNLNNAELRTSMKKYKDFYFSIKNKIINGDYEC